jgi:hypothetical protein
MDTQSGNPTWVPAIIGQVEFPIITISKFKFLRKYSFYFEAQLWLIASEVQSDIDGRFAGGFRINLF